MSEERLRILRMLEEGKVTAEEAAGLIEALGSSRQTAARPEKARALFLRIHIWEDGEKKVKINLPLALARAAVGSIPVQAHQHLHAQGIDIDRLLHGITENLEPGSLVEIQDDGDRVEVVLE